MGESTLLTIIMPLAIGVIMLGLGLSLTIDDFTRIIKYPKAVIVGFLSQFLILPVICLFVAKAYQLSPELAVGLMLLAASPGGATANLYSHLFNGDVALNITLTAVSSILALITLPIIVNLSLMYFMGESQYISIQFGKTLQVFAVVLIPVFIGMIIHKKRPSISAIMEKPVKISSAILLALVIIAVVIQNIDNMKNYFQEVGLAALSFNLLSLCVGYFLSRWLKITKRQAIAISMEVGIHNGTLAIFIAISLLNNETMAIPAAIYSLIMFFTAAAFGYFVNLRKEEVIQKV